MAVSCAFLCLSIIFYFFICYSLFTNPHRHESAKKYLGGSLIESSDSSIWIPAIIALIICASIVAVVIRYYRSALLNDQHWKRYWFFSALVIALSRFYLCFSVLKLFEPSGISVLSHYSVYLHIYLTATFFYQALMEN